MHRPVSQAIRWPLLHANKYVNTKTAASTFCFKKQSSIPLVRSYVNCQCLLAGECNTIVVTLVAKVVFGYSPFHTSYVLAVSAMVDCKG